MTPLEREPVWLDAFIFRPTIGVSISANLRVLLKIRDVVIPAIEESFNWKKVSLPEKGPFEFITETEEDLVFHCRQDRILVSYQYQETFDQAPGGWRTVKPPEIKPFTELLPKVKQGIEKICSVFPEKENVGLNFIGIVAEGILPTGQMPPGLTLFLDHLGKPWEGEMEEFQGSIRGVVEEKPKETDRCHHRITLDREKKPDEIRIAFDFQRVFKEPGKLGPEPIRNKLDSIEEAFYAYINRFGKGDLKYA